MSEACVILNDIHIDIMDYIKPAYCNEAQVIFPSNIFNFLPTHLSSM
jgi:hypothetical protein